MHLTINLLNLESSVTPRFECISYKSLLILTVINNDSTPYHSVSVVCNQADNTSHLVCGLSAETFRVFFSVFKFVLKQWVDLHFKKSS